MNHPASWRWAVDNVRFDPDAADDEVWINPQLPPPERRASHPLRVEILCMFSGPSELAKALGLIQRFFDVDSILAAIERQDSAWRFVIYTAANESTAQRWYREMRETWKPTMLGLRVVPDPTWETLVARLDDNRRMRGERATDR